MEYCCTCAKAISSACPSSTKPQPETRTLDCCGRTICGTCILENNRFAYYCPYCQVSSIPQSLPQGLRDPPSYTATPTRGSKTTQISDAPPAYTLNAEPSAPSPTVIDDEKAALAGEDKVIPDDTLHFLNHEHDTIISLSLRYGVPAPALRAANKITSDHLLLGRRTILIPGEYYTGGVSLSPRPIEGEDGELRKGKIRRFMTSCKVSDYDVAVLYLEQSSYDLDTAVESYIADETWEREQVRNGRPGVKALKGHKNRGPFL